MKAGGDPLKREGKITGRLGFSQRTELKPNKNARHLGGGRASLTGMSQVCVKGNMSERDPLGVTESQTPGSEVEKLLVCF